MIDQSRGAKREPARSERLRASAATLGAACGVAGSASRPRGVRSTETKLEAQGGLSTESVALIVRASHARLRECYERGLARNPALRGAVTVTFAVDASGDPAELRTSASTLGDDAVVACVEVVYHTLKFPLPAKGKATVVSGIEFGVE
jgi:Ca-activated chloride channel family protein